MDRIVICPYCQRHLPEPLQAGLTHSCPCGAVFAAISDEDLGAGLVTLVSGLFEETTAAAADLLENCQVTVYRDYQAKPEPLSGELSRLIKEIRFETDPHPGLNLVWVARGTPNPGGDPFDQGPI